MMFFSILLILFIFVIFCFFYYMFLFEHAGKMILKTTLVTGCNLLVVSFCSVEMYAN